MATIKKAQKGKTVMQKLKDRYPKADTSAAGDTRFQEYNAYASKKFLDELAATDSAFNKKYGKDQPAIDKKPVKKQQAGGVTKANPKAPMVDPDGAFTKVQKRTIAGTKMAKKRMSVKKGMHKMPNGSMMKNSAMKSKSKKK
jgi:hypothetical protein